MGRRSGLLEFHSADIGHRAVAQFGSAHHWG